jgi:SpoVK/Ycf46/Vps4 family AAA+-type ATPase
VLIDGIDTLAPRRANSSAADLSLDRVLSQLLIEIDGMFALLSLLYSLCFTLSALTACFTCFSSVRVPILTPRKSKAEKVKQRV